MQLFWTSLFHSSLPAKMQKSGLKHFISTPVFPSMVDAKGEHVSQDKVEKFVSKFWGDSIRGTPQMVKVLETEPAITLYPALKVQVGCQILHITQAMLTVSIYIS